MRQWCYLWLSGATLYEILQAVEWSSPANNKLFEMHKLEMEMREGEEGEPAPQ